MVIALKTIHFISWSVGTQTRGRQLCLSDVRREGNSFYPMVRVLTGHDRQFYLAPAGLIMLKTTLRGGFMVFD